MFPLFSPPCDVMDTETECEEGELVTDNLNGDMSEIR